VLAVMVGSIRSALMAAISACHRTHTTDLPTNLQELLACDAATCKRRGVELRQVPCKKCGGPWAAMPLYAVEDDDAQHRSAVAVAFDVAGIIGMSLHCSRMAGY